MNDNVANTLRQIDRAEDLNPLWENLMTEQAAALADFESRFIADLKTNVESFDEESARFVAAMTLARWIRELRPADSSPFCSPFDVLLRPRNYVAPCAPICVTPGPYRVN